MASINSITKPPCDLVEKNTTKQSNTTLWHDHRAGCVTASTAREVVHCQHSPSLVTKLCVPSYKPLSTPAIEWGKTHEMHGVSLIAFMLNNKSSPPKIAPTGRIYSSLALTAHTNGTVA